jgi:endonuclease/exonuclease/phosphatase family metal-dependent hydrolase
MDPSIRKILGFVMLISSILLSSVYSQTHTPLKIVTFNLHGWELDWPARQTMIVEELSKIQPDVVGLQEVLETPGLKGVDNSAKVLAEHLSIATGYNYHYVFVQTHFAWDRYDEGIAILTRHLILDSDVRFLPVTLFQRKALWARILTPEGIIHFVTTHLDHLPQDEPNREAQVNAIKKFIEEKNSLQHAATVVCGDFNAAPGAPSIQHLTQKDSLGIQYIDTWANANPGLPGYTIPSDAPAQRIDYIFVKAEGTPPAFAASQVLHQPNGNNLYPSDHIGVMTTFPTRMSLLPAAILSPLPGDEVAGITSIKWSIAGMHEPVTTTLYLSDNAGKSWNTLFNTSAAITSYEWNTTAFKDGTRYLLMLVVQGDSSFGLAESATPFIVNNPGNAPPEISLLAPAGGEQIVGEFDISWTAADADGDALRMFLEATTNAGRTWVNLTSNEANDGLYRWNTAAMPNSANYQLRLIGRDDSTQTEMISAVFSVANPRLAPPDSIFKHIAGTGSGSVHANIVNPAELTGHTYRLTFDDTSSATKTYEVFDEDAQRFVVQNAVELDGVTEGPAFDGLRLVVADLLRAKVDPDRTGWLIGHSNLDITISLPEINLGNVTLKGFPYPADYKITLYDHPVDTSATYWGAPATPMYFTATNLTENRRIEVLYIKAGANLSIESSDEIYFIEKDQHGEPMLTWLVFFSGLPSATLPQLGDEYLLATLKPFSNRDIFKFSTMATGVSSDKDQNIPVDFALWQNYPNPFNAATIISFVVPSHSAVKVEIFNLTGQRVRTLTDEVLAAGVYHKIWDGKSDGEKDAASGIYFYRLTARNIVQQRKMILLR